MQQNKGKNELGDLKNAPPKISQRRISVNSSTKGYFLFQYSQNFPNNDISLASIYEDLSFCRNKAFLKRYKRGDSTQKRGFYKAAAFTAYQRTNYKNQSILTKNREEFHDIANLLVIQLLLKGTCSKILDKTFSATFLFM